MEQCQEGNKDYFEEIENVDKQERIQYAKKLRDMGLSPWEYKINAKNEKKKSDQ